MDQYDGEDPTIASCVSPDIFGFILVAVLCQSAVYVITKKLEIPIVNRAVMVGLGLIFGVLARHFEPVEKYTTPLLSDINPRHMFSLFFPMYVFRVCINLESYVFMRCWAQIVIISSVGYLAVSMISGFLMTSALFVVDLKLSLAFVYGLVICQTYSVEVVNILQNLTDVKHLRILLEMEGILSDCISIIFFDLLMGIHDGFIEEWYQGIHVFLRFFVGGLFMGFAFVWLSVRLLRFVINDPLQITIFTIIVALTSYHVPDEFSFCGLLSCLMAGIAFSLQRSIFRSRIDRFLKAFWAVPNFIVTGLITFMAGTKITKDLLYELQPADILLALVMYVVVYITRFIVFILLAPVLSRLSCGLTVKECIFLVWGCLRGLYSFIFAMIMMKHENPVVEETGKRLFVIHCAVMILSVLINGCTVRVVMRIFGMGEISAVRKSNMTACLKHLESKRLRCITALKYDRFLSDAKWSLVYETTVLTHPYRVHVVDDDEDEQDYLGYRMAVCPDCLREVPTEPTRREMEEMIREARRRILKGQAVSYARQYENGLLSKLGFRILSNTIETALGTKEVLVVLDDLIVMLDIKPEGKSRKRKILRTIFTSERKSDKVPSTWLKRLCYKIMINSAFDAFIYIVIILNFFLVLRELIMTQRNRKERYIITSLSISFYMVYLLEFWIKVLGLSVDTLYDGLKNYFSSAWNIFDFTILVFATVDVCADLFVLLPGDLHYISRTISVARALRVIRLFRLLRLCGSCYTKCMKIIEERKDRHLMLSYEIGKAYVTSLEEVQEMLVQMIDNKKVREDCRIKIETDRLAITRRLGIVQKDRPLVTITVKTKQAIVATLNSMKNLINEIKVSGWVDDIEYRKLRESLFEKYKYVNSLTTVQPSSPKEMLKEIPWLAGDDALADYLFRLVVPKTFNVGEEICVRGQNANGIYIVIQGLLRLQYVPTQEFLSTFEMYGVLPVVDFLTTIRFDKGYEEYIGSGNSIGELAMVTGRPYSCTISAETVVHLYLIPAADILEAFEKNFDVIDGMKARMWKMIATRLAMTILLDVPTFQTGMQSNVRFILDRAFVPDLSHYYVLVVTDVIEDVVLIEGVCMDYNTREIYYAPCYLPRTLQKIMLPTSEQMQFNTTIETKLLIMPGKDVDEYDVMDAVEELSELNRTDSFRQMQKERRRRRKKKRHATFSLSQNREKLPSKKSRVSGLKQKTLSSTQSQMQLSDDMKEIMTSNSNARSDSTTNNKQ